VRSVAAVDKPASGVAVADGIDDQEDSHQPAALESFEEDFAEEAIEGVLESSVSR
jgi:hypothetical protein